jgi:hypothetical protein
MYPLVVARQWFGKKNASLVARQRFSKNTAAKNTYATIDNFWVRLLCRLCRTKVGDQLFTELVVTNIHSSNVHSEK